MASQQFCTFFLEGYLFGVPVPQVQEVIRFQPMTPVPLAPPEVKGMINLRGQIVLAIDLRQRLSLSPRPEGELPMNVVVRSADGAISLLVDEIGDVIEVEQAPCARPFSGSTSWRVACCTCWTRKRRARWMRAKWRPRADEPREEMGLCAGGACGGVGKPP